MPAGSSADDDEERVVIAGDEEYSATSSTPTRVTLREFSQIAGVSYQTALRYKNEGLLKVIHIGGRFYVSRGEVDRFLNEGNQS